jgi:phosphopantothenoylcysteine decarboxylase/phosphopantothenate--cysteine ligase
MVRVLVTTGPTQEPIDDVRYITNSSSGKMGAAVALEAMNRGYTTTLVHGPVSIALPDCRKIPVTTTKQMVDAVLKELKKGYDIFISAAAISDFAPKKACGKIKSGECLKLELDPTPKLIDTVRAFYPKLFMVAFKAEHGLRDDELKVVAKDFLNKKGLEMVVANDVAKDVFGYDENELIIATRETAKHFGRKSKTELAGNIWDEIELRTKKVCPV